MNGLPAPKIQRYEMQRLRDRRSCQKIFCLRLLFRPVQQVVKTSQGIRWSGTLCPSSSVLDLSGRSILVACTARDIPIAMPVALVKHQYRCSLHLDHRHIKSQTTTRNHHGRGRHGAWLASRLPWLQSLEPWEHTLYLWKNTMAYLVAHYRRLLEGQVVELEDHFR